MRHLTASAFWKTYDNLPAEIQESAKKNFDLLKQNPNHPSIRFKKIKSFWSIRVSKGYRALGLDKGEDIVWFWIGSHSDYDKLIK